MIPITWVRQWRHKSHTASKESWAVSHQTRQPYVWSNWWDLTGKTTKQNLDLTSLLSGLKLSTADSDSIVSWCLLGAATSSHTREGPGRTHRPQSSGLTVHWKQPHRGRSPSPPPYWGKSRLEAKALLDSGKGHISLKVGTHSSFDQNPSSWPVGIRIHFSAKHSCQGGGLPAAAGHCPPRVWHRAWYIVGIQ